ncbi:ACT domain-containing protein [bacterium]|nr:ACT domain-containing protein [bacterium]
MQDRIDLIIETQPKITMVVAKSLSNSPGIAAELFSALGTKGFNIEMITQSIINDNTADISFAIMSDDAQNAVEHLKTLSDLSIKEFILYPGMGILTVYAKGLSGIPGIAGKVFSILAKEGVNIEMISTSLSSISVLILEEYLAPSKNILDKELKLNA